MKTTHNLASFTGPVFSIILLSLGLISTLQAFQKNNFWPIQLQIQPPPIVGYFDEPITAQDTDYYDKAISNAAQDTLKQFSLTQDAYTAQIDKDFSSYSVGGRHRFGGTQQPMSTPPPTTRKRPTSSAATTHAPQTSTSTLTSNNGWQINY